MVMKQLEKLCSGARTVVHIVIPTSGGGRGYGACVAAVGL